MNAAEYVLAGGLAVAGPDKPAIVSGDGSVTYGELALRVNRFAAALREAGMNPGDRIAILMLDHPDLVAIYLATIAAGGIAITVSTRATSDDLRHTLAIVRPFAVVTESDFAPAVAAGMAPSAKLFLRERHMQSWVQRSEMEFAPCARKPNDPAYWVMTSGTTGQPKAVEHRHDNVCACTDYLVHGLAATAADRFFPTSRLNFAYALGAMFGALRLGATLILHERWPTPLSIAATVDLHRPSIVLSVPTLFHKLCESGFAPKVAFRAVRCYVSAGERLPPRIGVEWEKVTGRPIVDAMSCSELVHKIFTNTLSARRTGSSGRPVLGVEVRLIDQDGSEITQPGRSGRLEVRAPFLCAGYRIADAPPHVPAHRPTERFRGEWFATGDEYLRDEDGFYHHCGRSDDMLKVSGLWVSPSEIEDALADIPMIAEAAAVLGERFGLDQFSAERVRSYLALIFASHGKFKEGIAQGQEGIRIAEALDHPSSLANVCLCLAILQITRGEISRAVGLLERGRATSRQWNLTIHSEVLAGCLGYAHALSGRTAEGIPLLEQALSASEAMRYGVVQPLFLMYLGRSVRPRRPARGRSRNCRASPDLYPRRRSTRLRGAGPPAPWRSHARHDPPDHAEGYYREALALAEGLGMRPLVAHCHLGLGKLYRHTATREQAQEHVATATTMYRDMGMTYWLEQADAEMRQLQ